MTKTLVVPDSPISVDDLVIRYGIVRSSFYVRKAAIEAYTGQPFEFTEKIGRKSAASPEQVALFDRMDAALAEGKTFDEFLESEFGKLETPKQEGNGNGKITTTLPNALTNDLIGLIAARLISLPEQAPPQNRNVVEAYRTLEEFAEHPHWRISSADLGEILGRTPSNINAKGSEFGAMGFVFTRCQKKEGSRVMWNIARGGHY